MNLIEPFPISNHLSFGNTIYFGSIDDGVRLVHYKIKICSLNYESFPFHVNITSIIAGDTIYLLCIIQLCMYICIYMGQKGVRFVVEIYHMFYITVIKLSSTYFPFSV